MKKVLITLALCSCGGNFEALEGTDAGDEDIDAGEEGDTGSTDAGIQNETGNTDTGNGTGDADAEHDAGTETPSPLAWWRFDGDGLDSSGNNHHLVFSNVDFVNNAVIINVNSNIQAPSFGPVFQSLLDEEFTLEFLLRFDTADNEVRTLWALKGSGPEGPLTNNWSLQIRPPSLVIYTEKGLEGSDFWQPIGTLPSPYIWSNIEVRVKGSSAHYIVDGVDKGVTPFTPAETEAKSLFIASGLFVGAIDDIKIFGAPQNP